MLRELLTPNIQRIESICAIGAMLQQIKIHILHTPNMSFKLMDDYPMMMWIAGGSIRTYKFRSGQPTERRRKGNSRFCMKFMQNLLLFLFKH